MTGCATTESDQEKRFAPWILPTKEPDKNTKKCLVAEALKIAVIFIMKHHVYEFDGKMMKQSKGGPIGLNLTGDLAAIYMAWWDKEFQTKIKEHGIETMIYKRYVDDIDLAVQNCKKNGNEENHTQKKTNETPEGKREKAKEKETIIMEKLKRIGNSIHPSIQLEADYPTLHEDQKLPILDVKMWVADNNKILHEFYQKDISSKAVVNARSSLPWSTKRTVLTQEILRIILRCSPDLPWEQVKNHVEMFMARMQFSGYNKKFRAEVLNSALKAYTEIKRKDIQGEQPLYRPKQWKQKERKEQRRNKKNNWYEKG